MFIHCTDDIPKTFLVRTFLLREPKCGKTNTFYVDLEMFSVN